MIAFLHFHGADGPDGFLDVEYRSPIEYRKAIFGSAAHLIVYLEARFYGDDASEARARFATSPKVAQAIGRAIRRDPVLERAWNQQRGREIAYALRLKFEQHPELAKRLVDTGDALLCYANPAERVWGIGLADNHPNACQPRRWPGANLLGLALTLHGLRKAERQPLHHKLSSVPLLAHAIYRSHAWRQISRREGSGRRSETRLYRTARSLHRTGRHPS